MICSKCKKHTPKHGFAIFRHRDGRIGRRGICKDCRGKYAIDNFEKLKKWRKNYNKKNRSQKRINDGKRRSEIRVIINEIKTKAKCADCGKRFPAVAMDFDHIKGKNNAIGNLVSGAYKLELILEEIKLCEIVCACCHRVRTHKRKQNHAPRKSGAP